VARNSKTTIDVLLLTNICFRYKLEECSAEEVLQSSGFQISTMFPNLSYSNIICPFELE